MTVNGMSIFLFGIIRQKKNFKNKGYTWIDNPFKDWMEDKKHFMKEERLGYYVR